MVIYEVTLTIQSSIAGEYRTWLDRHIGELLQIDGFEAATTYEQVDTVEDHVVIVVQYSMRDLESLDRYFATDAVRMRAAAVERFGSQFSASRRVLRLVRRHERQ
jgi:hypothetical protein